MIALERAFLCLDEDLVYNGALSRGCPQCGSRNTMPIARWLNRPGTIHISGYAVKDYPEAAKPLDGARPGGGAS